MNEDRFAYRIRQALNQRLDDISPTATRRLSAARHFALAHQKQSVRQAEFAAAGGAAFSAGHDWLHSFRARQALAIAVLLLGMAVAVFWHGHQYVTQLEDVDSAVLTDAMPPDAFLDKGFAAWLADSSED